MNVDDAILRFYIGETCDAWERFKNHFTAIGAFLLQNAYRDEADILIAKSLKDGEFFFTHTLPYHLVESNLFGFLNQC